MKIRLEIIPVSLGDANLFVERLHRHHDPVTGHKFSIAVFDGQKIVGVAIVGRPISRNLDDGWTLEVNRTCTDGTKNSNSMLYGAAWRSARAMGYCRIVTYTMPGESGASLRAAGWVPRPAFRSAAARGLASCVRVLIRIRWTRSCDGRKAMEFQEVSSAERCREYIFPAGTVRIVNVKRLCLRPSGTHRIETDTGEKYIVPAGWLAIKIDCDDWSF